MFFVACGAVQPQNLNASRFFPYDRATVTVTGNVVPCNYCKISAVAIKKLK